MGRPAVLIPLPTAADDHQTANAKLWIDSCGGWLIVEKEATPESIAAKLTELMQNPNELEQAASKAYAARPKVSAGQALGEVVMKEMETNK